MKTPALTSEQSKVYNKWGLCHYKLEIAKRRKEFWYKSLNQVRDSVFSLSVLPLPRNTLGTDWTIQTVSLLTGSWGDINRRSPGKALKGCQRCSTCTTCMGKRMDKCFGSVPDASRSAALPPIWALLIATSYSSQHTSPSQSPGCSGKRTFFHSVVCHCCLFIVVPGEKFFFSESGSELIPPLTRFYGFRLWGHQPWFSASVSSCAGFLMVCWALKVEKRRPGLSADLCACDGVSLLLSVCCHSILSIYHLSSVFVSWCLFQLLAEDLGKVIPGLMIVALWIWF